MIINVVAKNYQISDKFNEVLNKKIAKLDKYFDDDANCKIYLKSENKQSKIEISLDYRGALIRGEAKADNFYDAIDVVLPKIEKQMYKHRSKLESKLKKGAFSFDNFEPEDENFKLVKTKQFELPPISVQDAIDAFELSGYSFYVFNDKDAGKVKILYLRDDGNIGLIEPIIVK